MTSHPPWSEPHVEATHLTQVNCVPVRMEKGEPCIGRTANKHASDPVAAICPGVENLLIFGNDAINLIFTLNHFVQVLLKAIFSRYCVVLLKTRGTYYLNGFFLALRKLPFGFFEEDHLVLFATHGGRGSSTVGVCRVTTVVGIVGNCNTEDVKKR